MQKFTSIVKDESGQGMLEYIVAIGGIVLIVAAIMTALRTGLIGAATGGVADDTSAVGTLVTKVKNAVTNLAS